MSYTLPAFDPQNYPSPAEVNATLPIAWDRDETEACQRGVVGCCIDHTKAAAARRPGWPEQGCQTW